MDLSIALIGFGQTAQAFVAASLERLGAKVSLRMRAGEPHRTDQGNVILDCHFGTIADAAALAAQLSSIPGMVGHGLFIDEVDALYLADGGQLIVRERLISG